jgi:hypothetical protein
LIEPLRKGEPYPGRLPPVREQWAKVRPASRAVIVAVPAAIVGVLFAFGVAAGVAGAVLAVGAGLATATYVKNRTDRHNAAVDRGEIRVPPDPHLRRVEPSTLEPAVRERLARLGFPAHEIGMVERFDGGWLVERRRRTELAVALGDEGGVAYYDPRWVPDMRAATEFIAGRGHETEGI